MKGDFKKISQAALQNPAAFWSDAAQDVHWISPPEKVLDDARPPFYRWFTGGLINGCYNAVDCHVEAGHSERPAIIYDSAITAKKQTLTYGELQDRVARMAGVLQAHDIGYGDRVIIYMPMIPEALVAMLACARIGARHNARRGAHKWCTHHL